MRPGSRGREATNAALPDVVAAIALQTTHAHDPEPAQGVRLSLLGAFDLRVDGEAVPLPMNGQRVLAFLALQGTMLLRAFVAGSLWLDSTDDRAGASLRSALWRLNRPGHRLVEATGERLRLSPEVSVDVDVAVAQAQRLLDPTDAECPSPREVLMLTGDVLPDWYEDWVAVERERFRQLRVHALECLCERLTEHERFGEAIDAGLAATKTEPLRESAHRALMRVHIAEGNISEALEHYRRFRRLLHRELGLAPSPRMEQLVGSITAR